MPRTRPCSGRTARSWQPSAALPAGAGPPAGASALHDRAGLRPGAGGVGAREGGTGAARAVAARTVDRAFADRLAAAPGPAATSSCCGARRSWRPTSSTPCGPYRGAAARRRRRSVRHAAPLRLRAGATSPCGRWRSWRRWRPSLSRCALKQAPRDAHGRRRHPSIHNVAAGERRVDERSGRSVRGGRRPAGRKRPAPASSTDQAWNGHTTGSRGASPRSPRDGRGRRDPGSRAADRGSAGACRADLGRVATHADPGLHEGAGQPGPGGALGGRRRRETCN